MNLPDGSLLSPLITPDEGEEKEEDEDDDKLVESKNPQDNDDLPDDPEQEGPGKYYMPSTQKG